MANEDKNNNIPVTEEQNNTPPHAKESLYDKIPLSYKQVDIISKVLIGLLVVVLVIGIATGNRF